MDNLGLYTNMSFSAVCSALPRAPHLSAATAPWVIIARLTAGSAMRLEGTELRFALQSCENRVQRGGNRVVVVLFRVHDESV